MLPGRDGLSLLRKLRGEHNPVPVILLSARGDVNESLTVLTLADLLLNLHHRTVTRADQQIELTAREFALLETFLSNPGRVLSRTFLSQKLWGYQFDAETNVIDVAVQRLRKKIDESFLPKLIQTVRGVGYSITAE